MTPEHIALVQRTFADVLPQAHNEPVPDKEADVEESARRALCSRSQHGFSGRVTLYARTAGLTGYQQAVYVNSRTAS